MLKLIKKWKNQQEFALKKPITVKKISKMKKYAKSHPKRDIRARDPTYTANSFAHRAETINKPKFTYHNTSS